MEQVQELESVRAAPGDARAKPTVSSAAKGAREAGASNAQSPKADSRRHLAGRYRQVRQLTEQLCRPLQTEDYVVQSMPDVSPTKWHLAHTAWFFETFVLKKFSPGYEPVVAEYEYLFNSYYNAVGPMHCRDRRGLITRPTVSEAYEYRRRIDQCMLEWLDSPSCPDGEDLSQIIILGLHHEQQHQELLLTDIKHVLAQNPLFPAYSKLDPSPSSPGHRRNQNHPPFHWLSYEEQLAWFGDAGAGFAYDNERPRHRQFVPPFQLASRLVTNGEYLEFIESGGYEHPEWWLSLGWQTVCQQGWKAPLYWVRREDGWHLFTLSGLKRLEPDEPVCHLSYFEAEAFARWAEARLPTEFEWEIAARDCPVEGNFVASEAYHPVPLTATDAADKSSPKQIYGDVWEWTRSSYSPYPGYSPEAGALGEYNGKFMCNQMVLRGGSCATSRDHIRLTYRNFFMPDKRWQFSGLRLARDIL